MAYEADWSRLRVQCYERDRRAGAECHICHGRYGPIRYDLRPSSDPYAYEPDHVLSRHDHPELALCPENVKASHVRCNRAKGKRAGIDPLGNRSRRWGS